MDRSDPSPQPAALKPEVSIIIPARNEEANLGNCLQSLVTQTGVAFEIIVVDDGSTDRTRQIADSFEGVRVIYPPPLPADWTGKNNAVIAGASAATGEWLLFTDADTIHRPGSLARAVEEVKKEKADLLSYSPEQIVIGLAERIVMPVVFAELAAQYPPARVRDQHSGIVAANGQYILVKRSAYDAVGGHVAVAGEILEDVSLAKAFRRAGFRIFFRYGGDAVSARMYRNWAELRDGWTKNLALLFPHPVSRASMLAVWWMVSSFAPLVVPTIALFWRIRRANFSLANTLLATLVGVPVFSYLLVRSYQAHTHGNVSWKGRTYAAGSGEGAHAGIIAAKVISPTTEQILRTENPELIDGLPNP
jgi:glycosyltransferase involved in cell wall biosynthesis